MITVHVRLTIPPGEEAGEKTDEQPNRSTIASLLEAVAADIRQSEYQRAVWRQEQATLRYAIVPDNETDPIL